MEHDLQTLVRMALLRHYPHCDSRIRYHGTRDGALAEMARLDDEHGWGRNTRKALVRACPYCQKADAYVILRIQTILAD
jgi:hypothetical protein